MLIKNKQLKRCFVVSPIVDEGTDIRRNADQLFQHIIKLVCRKCGFDAKRVDQFDSADSITQDILDALNEYELVIADMTGHNPDVFFEIGYRSKSQKPIIHLKRKGEAIPFDVSSIRTFEYDLTDLDMVSETKTRLEQVIKNYDYDDIDKSNKNVEIVNYEKNMIVSSLNNIQYKIDVLTEQIKKKDSEIIKILMSELIKNPEAADTLISLKNKFK